MNNLLSIFVGVIIAIMITINGKLTAYHGIFIAAIIIHIVGTIFAYMAMKLTKQHLRLQKNSLYGSI